jgi:hypothetical protein
VDHGTSGGTVSDITPIIDFELRPSEEELTTPIDDELDAHIWRELAREALSQLAAAHVELDRLRARLKRPARVPRSAPLDPEYMRQVRAFLRRRRQRQAQSA